MKHFTALFSAVFLFANLCQGQVTKSVVVEHFTNSRCGICANKNPLLRANLEAHPEVLHLAIHPSAPYDDCVFHLNNATENDARANFYGVYGGTPRLVINGDVKGSGVAFGDSTLFDAYAGQSDFSIETRMAYVDDYNNAVVRTVIRRASNTMSNNDRALVFGALAEAEVNLTTPNGESEHDNVYRAAVFGSTGEGIQLPTAIGDSVALERTVVLKSDWSHDQLYVLVILQDSSTQEVIQAAATEAGNILGVTDHVSADLRLRAWPNPAHGRLTVAAKAGDEITIWSMQGALVVSQRLEGQEWQFDTTNWPAGMYLVRTEEESLLISVAR